MFGFFRKRYVMSEQTRWQFEVMAYLVGKFGVRQFLDTPLQLPTAEEFPANGLVGHALAEHYFTMVRERSAMSSWPCRLVMVEADGTLGELTVPIAYSGRGTAGTFQLKRDGAQTIAEIRYDEKLISNPVDLMATFSHELAHFLLVGLDREMPGGEPYHEFATDMAAVYMGWGIFQLRSAFRFDSYSDGVMSGYSSKRAGYLSRPQFAFALAIFTEAKGIDPAGVCRHLNDQQARMYRTSVTTIRDQGLIRLMMAKAMTPRPTAWGATVTEVDGGAEGC